MRQLTEDEGRNEVVEEALCALGTHRDFLIGLGPLLQSLESRVRGNMPAVACLNLIREAGARARRDNERSGAALLLSAAKAGYPYMRESTKELRLFEDGGLRRLMEASENRSPVLSQRELEAI